MNKKNAVVTAMNSKQYVKVGWFLWHINLCMLFNTKSIFMKKFYFKQFSLA